MISPDRDSLARDYSTQAIETPDIPGLPDVDDSSLLDRFLSKLAERIKNEGLNSFLWVSGIRTQDIAARLMKELKEVAGGQQFEGDDFAIVTKPSDNNFIEPFATDFGITIMKMNEIYLDSFIIVNNEAVLDMTPVSADDGKPEFNEDPTVVSLYMGLFNMLKNNTVPA